MPALSGQQVSQLREALAGNLRLDFFEDDEIRDIFDAIDSLAPAFRQKTLALCLSLSHASSAFVVSTLRRIRKAAKILQARDMERWLSTAFDLLDARGIDPFIAFVSKAEDQEELRRFQVPAGMRLHSVLPRLESYIQGISGLALKIAQGRTAHTDTATIYLPVAVGISDSLEQNFLVYKLMVVCQWARISCGTLMPDNEVVGYMVKKSGNHPDIETIFRGFRERELALDLFNLFEAFRLESFLKSELPGLMRNMDGLKERIINERPVLEILPDKITAVEGIYQHYLSGGTKGKMPEGTAGLAACAEALAGEQTAAQTFKLLCDAYKAIVRLNGEYSPLDLSFLGTIRPEKVSRLLRQRRNEKKKKYDGVINKILSVPDYNPEQKQAILKQAAEEKKIEPAKEYIVIKGRIIELDAELREMIDERGGIPGGILVKGSDLGAGSPISLSDLAAEEEIAEVQVGGIPYDEWDFRRLGYKKHWCNLYERDIHPGHDPFVDVTLKRYGAYVRLLRNKFELLKREPKILRRQKDGDDIDIDATVEAFSDMRAGLSPGEDVFVRLDRQERNIAVLFLLDMSGSTKGWVNEAEKESLVLMCEALEALGDNYSIFGFSGMTRTKCDYYRIKGFDEAYSETVKKRIAGITPKDYTRMGPAIRHSIGLLKSVEARTRLLIILSDGKPEDWDAYKGEYAIEDTRKALIEAREKRIYPFCITIDKEGRSYLPHMYGESNYILIDDVRKLPNKITEIYRRITV